MKTLKKFRIGEKREHKGTPVANRGKKGSSGAKIQYQWPKYQTEEVYDELWICPDSKMQMVPVGSGHIFY